MIGSAVQSTNEASWGKVSQPRCALQRVSVEFEQVQVEAMLKAAVCVAEDL